MKNINKFLFKLSLYFLCIINILIFPLQNSQLIFANPGDVRGPTNYSIMDVINNVTGLLGPLVLIVFLVMLVYGGFMRMTAGGDPEKEAQSNKIITGAVIGFIIIALAPLIINLLGQFIGTGQLIQ